MLGNKFNLGDLVFHNGTAYWVTGVVARPKYDGIDWEYNLTKPAYHEATTMRVQALGGRLDVDTIEKVREYAVQTKNEYKHKRITAIKEQAENLQKELTALENERKLLES